MSTPLQAKNTAAFYVQSIISFGVALSAMGLAVVFLPVGPWIRSFLALGLLYLVTASFTLAKCVRDKQETTEVVSRVDQARLDKLLTEHDPFRASKA
ncbi:YiaA/YiaB family inner membrane protein [Longispora sp. NPDC051575]|uniref:YiaA/YiaB family inner membrane protein n=1 Tax=Longispora sp. NPDC051575 TaxID=3154943 RepID=UPI00343308A7